MSAIKKYVMFKHELEYVATMMQRNDPNGEYCTEDIAADPMVYMQILEQWKEDCGYIEPVPKWIDVCVDYLILFADF